MFATTNFRFLRISKTGVLPLNLFLSEEDLEWFNDYTFQVIVFLFFRAQRETGRGPSQGMV